MSATKTDKPPRIVAGVDGSAPSLAALRWAVYQAELTGGTVDAIVAWRLPVSMTGYGFAPVAMSGCSDIEQIAKQALDEAMSKVAGRGGDSPVRSLVVQGFPAQVLLSASAARICSSWAAAATADSPAPCSARWVSVASVTRAVPW